MEYYYADAANEPRGPVSEEVLKNLFFQRRISLDSNVLLAGTSDWRGLRDCFPDLEFYRGCPKCYQKVTVGDRTCPQCHFPIADYEENLLNSRRRPTKDRKASESEIDASIRAELAGYNNGCVFCFMIGISLLLCFIPLFGVIIGAITFVVSLVLFLSPVDLKLWWYRNTSGGELAKLREKALARLTSPFLGPCPKCNQQITDQPTALLGSVSCPHCGSRLEQQRLYIYYIPHPSAVLTNDFNTLFSGEENA